MQLHCDGPLLAKRNTVGHNLNRGIVSWLAHCGDQSAASRDFQSAVAAMGLLSKKPTMSGIEEDEGVYIPAA